MIALSLKVSSGFRISNWQNCTFACHAKHYKHNEDGRTVTGVHRHGSVLLSAEPLRESCHENLIRLSQDLIFILILKTGKSF